MTTINTVNFTQTFTETLSAFGFEQDRLPGDQLKLPHDWFDIKIKPNDFVFAETINNSIQKLYTNWLYMCSMSVIPTNNIPNIDFANSMYIDKGLGIQWADQDDWETSAYSSELNGIEHLLKIPNLINSQSYNLIAATTTNLILLSGTETDIDVIINPDSPQGPIKSDSSVTHPSNEIFFENIVDLDVTDDLDLFVLDSNHKLIFKFDISGITSLDDAILKNDTPGRLLTNTVGGNGILSDKTKFLNPVCFVTVNNNIFVVDQDTNNNITIKQYDSHLNWKNSFDIFDVFDMQIVDINYNPSTERFYILSHTPNQFLIPKISIFTSNFEFIESVEILNEQEHSTSITMETFRKLYFSYENPNMLYILTNNNVYKKYTSRPEAFVGTFILDDNVKGNIGPDEGNRDFKDMVFYPAKLSVNNQTVVKDEILLVESIHRGVYQFFEDSGFENSLETEIEDMVFDLEDLKILPEENVDSLVYNKTLYKTIFNNLVLLENISRKFSTLYNTKGFPVYVGFKYLTEEENNLLQYDITPDFFISSNEIVLNETVNRCLNQILQLQQLIVFGMQEKKLNVYPIPQIPVELN